MNRISLVQNQSKYPIASMILVLALVLLSPFTSMHINWVAFAICIIRMVRYDEKIFATDYCILMPLTQTFRMESGMSLLVWLCLVASVRFFVMGKIRGSGALICVLLLLNYLLTRMGTNVNDFVLCFGQLFVLYVLLPKQNTQSAVRSAIAFCWSMTLTSVYALIFRNTSQIIALRGAETPAIWGLDIMRFYGLFYDPNYYTTLLIAGLALLCKLRETEYIGAKTFWILGAAMSLFGMLTCSKAFILVFVLLGGVYIVWQYWNKKALRGMAFSLAIVVFAAILLLYEDSPLAVVLNRLTSAEDLDSLTTGRWALYGAYIEAITKNAGTILFGYGIDTDRYMGVGAHNIYLEAMYYVGIIGLILILAFYFCMIQLMQKNKPEIRKQGMISKYIVLLMTAVIYFSLQGLFIVMTYAAFFLSLMAMMIVPQKTIPVQQPLNCPEENA